MNSASRSKHDRVNVMCIDMRELFRRANAHENSSHDDTNAFSIQNVNNMYTPCTEQDKTEQWIRGTYVKNSILPPLSPADPVVIEEVLHDPHPLHTTHSSRCNNHSKSSKIKISNNNTRRTNNYDTQNTQRIKNHSTFLTSHISSTSTTTTTTADHGRKKNEEYSNGGSKLQKISMIKREAKGDGDNEITIDKVETVQKERADSCKEIKSREKWKQSTSSNNEVKELSTTKDKQHSSSMNNNNLLSASVNALPLTTLRQMTNILHSYRVNSDGDNSGNNYNNDNLVDKISWGKCPSAPHTSSILPFPSSSSSFSSPDAFSLPATSKYTNLNVNADSSTVTQVKPHTELTPSSCREKREGVINANSRPKRCEKVQISKFVQQIIRSTRAQMAKPELKVKKNDDYSNERMLLQQRRRRQERINNADVDEQRHIPRMLLWTRTADKLSSNERSRRPKQR